LISLRLIIQVYIIVPVLPDGFLSDGAGIAALQEKALPLVFQVTVPHLQPFTIRCPV